MKAIDSSLINKSAKTTSGNREEACPTCGEASWCFENGVVHCADHGYFEPEPSDTRLFGMLQAFNEKHRLSFPLAGMEPQADVPGDDSYASRHRPVPAFAGTVIASGDRVDGDIQRAYAGGSRAQS